VTTSEELADIMVEEEIALGASRLLNQPELIQDIIPGAEAMDADGLRTVCFKKLVAARLNVTRTIVVLQLFRAIHAPEFADMWHAWREGKGGK
jgi:hypothetical protein